MPSRSVAPTSCLEDVCPFLSTTRAEKHGADGRRLAASFAAGTLLLLVNLAARFAPQMVRVWRWAGALDAEGFLYWMVVFGLILPGLGYALVRARRATPSERRRVRLLLAGLALGFGPALLAVVLSVLPSVARLLDRPAGLRAVGLVIYPALLSIPITTGYAVLTYQALDVRLVLRRALQYALARSTLLGVVVLPFAVLVVLLYTRREERLTDLVSGSTGALLAAVLAVGAAGLYLRTPLMELLDRSFFREQYDGRRVLAALVERTRAIRDPEELAGMLAREIDRALHLHAVHALFLDPAAGVLSSPAGAVEPLPVCAALARRLESVGVPLEVNLQRPAGWLAVLAEEERRWVRETGARLLVPVSAADGSLLGAVALGEKRSDLPFTNEDVHVSRGARDNPRREAVHLYEPRSAGHEQEYGCHGRPHSECRCGSNREMAAMPRTCFVEKLPRLEVDASRRLKGCTAQ